MSKVTVSFAENCIVASDFGLGGVIYVYANPNDDRSLDNRNHTDPKTGKTVKSKLLRHFPRGQQVTPWINTELFTTGLVVDDNNAFYSKLRGYVEGQWYPWGATPTEECVMLDCLKDLSSNAICLDEGKIVDDDPEHIYPCVLKKGKGLYGLIALENNGNYQDPNDFPDALTLPGEYFRTFHAEATIPGEREDENYFEVDYSQLCANNLDGTTTCIADKKDGQDYIMRGRLYFQILDRHYEDNTGAYKVNIISGVFAKKGFIEKTVEDFEEAIQKVTATIYQNISQNWKFITICRSMLVLYIAFTGVAFMMGLIRIQQQELIVRLIKVGLVATLISESSWEFFNTTLFVLFTNGAKDIAEMIILGTLYNDDNYNSPVFLMPEDATPLSVFDLFLKMFISKPVHCKTIAILFYDWKFYFIPAIYICFYFIILGILRSVFIYLLAVVQVALLLVSAPIFIIMVLFQFTKYLFDEWIKQLINSSILMIIVVSTIALMMTIVLDQLQQLLYYEVCWVSVWEMEIFGLELFDLLFWYPSYESQIDKALTAVHYFAFLLVCLVFDAFLEHVPQIADSLSNTSRPTAAETVRGAMKQFQGSTLASMINKVKAANPIGYGFDKIMESEKVKTIKRMPIIGTIFNMGEGVVRNPSNITKPLDDIMYHHEQKGPPNWAGKMENLVNKAKEGYNKGRGDKGDANN